MPRTDGHELSKPMRATGRRIELLHRSSIGLRLRFGFVFIIALMLIGDGVLLWQLHLIRGQAERLNGVDDELIEVLRVDAGLLSAYERLGAAARTEDTALLLKESDLLRSGLRADAERTEAAFNRLPPEVPVDQTVLPTLESIELSSPSYLEAIRNLAASGEWEAVRNRIDVQVQPLESLGSDMVRTVALQVGKERAEAERNIRSAERRIFIVIPLTGLVTLLIAAALGVRITSSITEPLGELVVASRALAQGDFGHQVQIIGKDEIAQLGYVFNGMADKLLSLYETLRKSEANLAEAQRLSRSGSWSWDVDANRMFWSTEAYNIFGFDPKKTTPSMEIFLQNIEPEDRIAVTEGESDLYQGKSIEYDFRIVLPDKEVKYIHSVVHPDVNNAGRVVGFVGTVTDVTTQRNSRVKLEAAFEEIKILRDQLAKENLALREDINTVSMFEDIVGSSEPLRRVLAQVAKVAETDSTVLILGETGTGKELIARAIHRRSKRATRAFIRVNCAAIPPTLVASELFGHEKGAFTGATQRRTGRFELADGGTIFLDEIGELPADIQSSILRVLQEGEFERVGSSQTISVNARILSATNRDLKAAVKAGTFREDLYYRLNVFPIQIPSLRERAADIPLLAEYLIDRYSKRAGKKFGHIDRKTLSAFLDYQWPGNIRELQNVVERAVVLCDTDTFAIDETWLRVDLPPASAAPRGLGRLEETEERLIIETALEKTDGRVAGPTGAAALLGLPRQTLESKIITLGINKHRFKRARQ